MGNRRPVLGGTPRLRGRHEECAVLDGLLAAVRNGESRTLVLRGEAGVGKTALLQYLVESAPDLHVVRAVGVESEMELAFASLHQLCAPMLDRLGRLPAPQRRGAGDRVRAERGAGAGPVPGRAGRAEPAVRGRGGAAGHVRRRRRAMARPAPRRGRWRSWLGGCWPSRSRSCSRRARPGEELSGACRSSRSRACATAMPARCWRSWCRVLLDERVRDRIVAETRGNPLALLELPRGLDGRRSWPAGSGCSDPQALSGRIEESFLRRLEIAARRRAAVAAGRGGGAGRRPAAAVARGRAARHRGLGAPTDGDGRAAGDRRAGDVPPSAGALGGLPFGGAGGAPGGPSRAGRGDRPGGRPRSSCLAPRGGGRRDPTRMSRSSSSARRDGRRHAAGWPPRRRSCAARSR